MPPKRTKSETEENSKTEKNPVPSKKGKLKSNDSGLSLQLTEWFVTLDSSSSAQEGKCIDRKIFTGIVTGHPDIENGSLYSTQPVRSTVCEGDIPVSIICFADEKCDRDGHNYTLGNPHNDQITTKVVDMIGPWGSQLDGGGAVHLQVSRHLRPVAMDLRSRLMEGLTGDRVDHLSLTMQLYQLLLLSNGLACKKQIHESTKTSDEDLTTIIKEGKLAEFCASHDIPEFLVAKLEELSETFGKLTGLTKTIHQVLYYKKSPGNSVAEDFEAAVKRGGLSKNVADRKLRFLDSCEHRAERVREQNKIKRDAEKEAKTESAKSELRQREAQMEAERLRGSIAAQERVVTSLHEKKSHLEVRLAQLQTELDGANRQMESALKSRGTLSLSAYTLNPPAALFDYEVDEMDDVTKSLNVELQLEQRLNLQRQVYGGIPLGPLAVTFNAILSAKQSGLSDLNAATFQIKEEERALKDLKSELRKVERELAA